MISKNNIEPIRTQNLGSLLIKLSQSNFNLRSPDCYWVRSYLITTVIVSKCNWVSGVDTYEAEIAANSIIWELFARKSAECLNLRNSFITISSFGKQSLGNSNNCNSYSKNILFTTSKIFDRVCD